MFYIMFVLTRLFFTILNSEIALMLSNVIKIGGVINKSKTTSHHDRMKVGNNDNDISVRFQLFTLIAFAFSNLLAR